MTVCLLNAGSTILTVLNVPAEHHSGGAVGSHGVRAAACAGFEFFSLDTKVPCLLRFLI